MLSCRFFTLSALPAALTSGGAVSGGDVRPSPTALYRRCTAGEGVALAGGAAEGGVGEGASSCSSSTVRLELEPSLECTLLCLFGLMPCQSEPLSLGGLSGELILARRCFLRPRTRHAAVEVS